MKVSLVLADGSEKGRCIEISGNAFVVGRGPDCDYQIPSPQVSRRHCEFVYIGKLFGIKDLGSRTGTFVNRRKIDQTRLDSGDRVTVGPQTFLIKVDQETAVAAIEKVAPTVASAPPVVQDERQPSAAPLPPRLASFLVDLKADLHFTEPKTDIESPPFQAAYAKHLALRRELAAGWPGRDVDNSPEQSRRFEQVELLRWHLERRLLGIRVDEDGAAAAFRRNRLGAKLVDFLVSPMEVSYQRHRLPTALGILNPYRLAGLSAAASYEQAAAAAQQSRRDLQAGTAIRFPLDVGLESIVNSRRVTREVQPAVWKRPQARLLDLLLWFHLSDSAADVIRRIGDVTNELVLAYLVQESANARDDSASTLQHAVAVYWLHVAIAREAAFAAGQIRNAIGYWDVAFHHWVKVCEDDLFWRYCRGRSQDAVVPAAMVQSARSAIPFLLAGVVGRFAREYGARGDSVSCHRLLSVLRRSRLPDPIRDAAPEACIRGSYY